MIALGLVTSIILARALGITEYGVYAYLMACVITLALPIQSGLPTLVVRDVARYRDAGEWSSVKGLLTWSIRTILIVSPLLIGVAAIWLMFSRSSFGGQYVGALAAAAILIPLGAILAVTGSFLMGLGRVVTGMMPDSVYRPALFLTFVVVMGTTDILPNNASVVIGLWLAATIIAIAIVTMNINRIAGATLRGATSKIDATRWRASLMPLTFLGASWVLMSQTDILILGVFYPIEEIGVYKVSVVGAMLTALGLQVLNTVSAPDYSVRFARGDKKGLASLAIRVARLATLFSAAAVLIYMFFGDAILEVVFGSEYAAAYSALVILSLGQLANCMSGSVGLILNCANLELIAARVVGAAMIFNLIFNLILIPPFGSDGAAIASGMSLALCNAVLWYLARSELGIDTSMFGIFHRSEGTA